MRFRFVLAIAFLLALAPLRAKADPPRDLAGTLRAMLSGVEHAPVDARIRALGPSAIEALGRLVADDATPTYVRMRAVHALALFEGSASQRELERACRSAEPLVAREAVLALAEGFGEDAIDPITAMWSHGAPEVREAVAMALGQIGTDEAKKRLAHRLHDERDANVRRAIQRALAAP